MKHLVKITLRNLIRNRRITTYNILGLSLAFVTILCIYSWLKFEMNYDTHFENSERLYRFTVEYASPDNHRHFARVIKPWIRYIPEFFPEVEQMVRLAPGRNSSIKIDQKKFYCNALYSTDSNFFEVFNVKLIQGDASNVLDEPGSAVICQTLAEKYFKNANPVGEELMYSHQFGEEFENLVIKGVMPDFPANSHFHPEILRSFENPEDYNSWFYTYVLLGKNTSIERLKNRLTSFKEKYVTGDLAVYQHLHFQPVEDIHLHSKKDREIEPGGETQSITILIIVGIILLFVVFINYTNFQIASVQERRKTYAVNLTFGGGFSSVLKTLITESILLVTVSSLLSLMVFVLSKIHLTHYLNIRFLLSTKELILIYLSVSGMFLFISMLISLYPFFLIRYSGNTRSLCSGNRGMYSLVNRGNEQMLGKILVFVQFAGAVCLIIATTVIFRQNNFLLSQRMGKELDNIINLINVPRPTITRYDLFKQELLEHPEILDVTAHMEEPAGETMDVFHYRMEGMTDADREKFIYLFPTDNNFLEFYDINLLSGESYFNDREKSPKYIVNESALKFLGYTDPDAIVGKRFKLNFPHAGFFEEGYIGGVVENFHLSSMQQQEKPLVLYHQNHFNHCQSIKIDPDNIEGAISVIRESWNKVNPEYDLQPHFIDDLYFELYANQIRQSKFLGLLTIVVMFISGLGLIGIAVYNANNRIKEIGVRKVNGARITEILILLNSDFIKWILLAYFTACPVTWFALKKWMENFAYQTEISWWIFTFAGCVVLFVSIITVSLQSWRAASKNPVEALRYE